MLDVTERLAVVVGGGRVAARKIQSLRDAGARRIRVVAPRFCDAIPADIERVVAGYQPQHLDGAGLVFAATDSPGVNEQVVRHAQARGLLVNRVDEGGAGGDFVTPAVLRQGEVIVATNAGSAALSAAVRDQLAAALDPRFVQMATLMTKLRPQIRDSGVDPQARTAIFRDLASEAALQALAQGGDKGLREWLALRYPQLKLQED